MDLLSIWRILQVVLGIGLVIFVHEAGHFMAARLCKVRVVVFSLGFGPKLFGWRKNGTDYQIAAVPLGGYVRMAGEETHYSGQPAAPDELGSKTVGQRFFIYSAGVIMNVIFGLVVFPVLFLVGIPSVEPIVGQVQSGSPAWVAGLEPGMRIVEVNGEEIYDLSQVLPEVAYSGTGLTELIVQRPGEDQLIALEVQPEYDETFDLYSIGNLLPAWAKGLPLSVVPGGAAELAGVRDGDQLLGVTGSTPGLDPAQQLTRAIATEAPFDLLVLRAGEELTFDLAPEAGPETPPRIGFVSLYRHLIAFKSTALTAPIGLAADDRLLSIDGVSIDDSGDVLVALTQTEGEVTWEVRRDNRTLTLQSPPLTQDEGIQLASELAVGYDQESTRVRVLENSASWRAGMRTGDEVTQVDGVEVEAYQDLVTASRAAAEASRALRLSIRREVPGGEAEYRQIEALPEPIATREFGLALPLAMYDYSIANPVEALQVGAAASLKMITDVARHLRGMMRREVGKQNVGSIIKISIVAHQTAEIGWVKFFWFLCLLSMNLAFLNVLPIPILDGGHLFFLIIEKLKGSPVSENIFSYSQLVGLVLIVSIFVFVIYNDLSQHVF